MRHVFVLLFAAILAVGCSRSQVMTYSKQASTARVFGGIKRVAVLPFDSLSEAAVGPKTVESTLVQNLLTIGAFDVVKEPRYVSALMKKLKLRNAESLDKEIVLKIGQELQVDGLLVGSLLLFGEEEKSTNTEFKMFLNMLEVETGDIAWAGSNYVRSSTSWGEVFGLSDAPSINELANQGVAALAEELSNAVVAAREDENSLIMKQAEEAEKIKEDGEDAKKAPEEKETEELLLKVKPK